jgi:hypothetical protein
VAGESRTCTNCGSIQAVGDFCERCGTRLPAPEAAPVVTSAPVTAAPVAPAAAAPVPVAQASAAPAVMGADQQAAYQQPAPPPYQPQAQPQYVAPRMPGPFSKLFDLSFQQFITRDSLKLIFTVTLALLGIYWVLALIFGIVAAARFDASWCIGIFSSLALVSLLIIWTRIMMELTMTVSKMREDMEKAAQEKAAETEAPKTKK